MYVDIIASYPKWSMAFSFFTR